VTGWTGQHRGPPVGQTRPRPGPQAARIEPHPRPGRERTGLRLNLLHGWRTGLCPGRLVRRTGRRLALVDGRTGLCLRRVARGSGLGLCPGRLVRRIGRRLRPLRGWIGPGLAAHWTGPDLRPVARRAPRAGGQRLAGHLARRRTHRRGPGPVTTSASRHHDVRPRACRASAIVSTGPCARRAGRTPRRPSTEASKLAMENSAQAMTKMSAVTGEPPARPLIGVCAAGEPLAWPETRDREVARERPMLSPSGIGEMLGRDRRTPRLTGARGTPARLRTCGLGRAGNSDQDVSRSGQSDCLVGDQGHSQAAGRTCRSKAELAGSSSRGYARRGGPIGRAGLRGAWSAPSPGCPAGC
jgi:hypothetical protein